MIFKHLYDTSLSQSSYFIGCQATGEAVVVDPVRDVDLYIALAEREGMRIAAVTETHMHADYCSGARELAFRTSAQLFLSGCGTPEWRYPYALDDRAAEVIEGDVIGIGNVRLTVLHTPGHSPEHISFFVTDGAVTEHPMGLLTGDFLFVGDVGRPDLLDTVAGESDSMDASARALHRSLQRLSDLPDHLQIWPGHGAGSVCGRALGSVPQSTLGYERLVNWALVPRSEDEFVAEVLRDQPEPPAYFAVMKRVNREGPALLGSLPEVPHRSGFEAQQWVEKLGMLVDARPAAEFAAAHIRGSLNIPGDRAFASWFGSLIDYNTGVWLIATDEAHGSRLVRDLMSIGFDRVVGVSVAADALIGVDPDVVTQRSPIALSGALGREGLIVIDVRGDAEWATGHIPGALHMPLAELPHRLQELPADGTLVVHCASGGRSAIAASLLLMAGASSVENLGGGMQAWTNAGLAITMDDGAVPVPGTEASPASTPPDGVVEKRRSAGAAGGSSDTLEIPPFVDRRRRER